MPRRVKPVKGSVVTLVAIVLIAAIIGAAFALYGFQVCQSLGFCQTTTSTATTGTVTGTVVDVTESCAPYCFDSPKTCAIVVPMFCKQSVKVSLMVTVASASPYQLTIYITAVSEHEFRASQLKAGDRITVTIHPAGYCQCGTNEPSDIWIASDNDWA
jgi:hypothetical protein